MHTKEGLKDLKLHNANISFFLWDCSVIVRRGNVTISECHFLMIQTFTHFYDTNGHTFLWQMDTRSNNTDTLSNDTDVHTFLWQMETHSYDIDGHVFLWYRWSHVLTTQTGTYSYDTDVHNYDKEGDIVMTLWHRWTIVLMSQDTFLWYG